MTLMRWLTAAVFFVAAAGAWHAAQPKQTPKVVPAAAPSNPFRDALNTESLIRQRTIVTPPEPIKISEQPTN